MAFARSTLLLAMSLLPMGSLQAEEGFSDTAVVVRKVIYPGQVIDTTVVKIVKLRESIPINSQYAIDLSEIVGKAPSSTLLPNRLVSLASLSEPPIIKAGDYIKMIYEAPGIVIYIDGMSLSDGSAGDAISVRNKVTGKQMQAFVIDGTTVRVSTR